MEGYNSLVAEGYNTYTILCYAIRSNDQELIDYMADNDITEIDYIAICAAAYGNKKVLYAMIERINNNKYISLCVDWIACVAAQNGHLDIVMEMIAGVKDENGVLVSTDDFDGIIKGAEMNNRMELANKVRNLK